MADSVGKISLDLDIINNNLSEQINKIASNVKNTIGKGVGDNLSKQFEQVGKGLGQSIGKGVESAEERIKRLSSVIDKSMAEQSAKVSEAIAIPKTVGQQALGNYASYDSSKISKEVSGESNESTATEQKISLFQRLSNGIRNYTSRMSEASRETNNVRSSTNNASSSLERMRESASGVISNLIRFTLMTAGIRSVQRALFTMFRTFGEALMMNSQFASSVSQIQSAFWTAFAPIYDAVLPALNTLMSALAKVSQYIAGFIAHLTGNTYSGAFQRAQQLHTQMHQTYDKVGSSARKAGDDIEESAKKAREGLMGFDEINKLGSDADKSKNNNKGDDFTPLAEPLQSALAPIDQMTSSWADKFKYAFEPLLQLFKDMGTSWENMWNSGIGESVMNHLKGIGNDLLSIIHNIGQDFDNAWRSGVGDEIMMNIGKTLDYLLELIHKITSAFDEWWSSNGNSVASTVLEIINTITKAIENLGLMFNIAWDNGGKKLFDSLLNLGKASLEVISDFLKDITGNQDTARTFGDALGWIADKLADVINFIANHKWILEAFLDLLVAKKVYDFANGIMSVLNPVKLFTQAQAILNAVLEANPVGLVIGVLAGLGLAFMQAWNHSETFRNVVKSVFNAIGDTAKWLGDLISSIFSGLWNVVKAPINWIIDAINWMIRGIDKISFDMPSWLGGGHVGFDIPQIPHLARGGIIDSPTLAMIGEGGRKEAVMPLESNTAWINELADKINARGGGSSDNPVEIHLNIGDTKLAKVIINSINDITRQNGGVCLINV